MFTWFLKLSERKQGALVWLVAMVGVFILGILTHNPNTLVWIYILSVFGAYQLGRIVKKGKNG